MKFIIVPPAFSLSEGKARGTMGVDVKIVPDYKAFNPHGSMMDVYSTPTHTSFVYDPLGDYANWYMDKNESIYTNVTVIYYSDITNKCWRKTDLSDWINTNAKGPVLAQQHAGFWQLHFTESVDKPRFDKWWSTYAGKTQLILSTVGLNSGQSNRALEQVKAWCEINCTGRWELTAQGTIVAHLSDVNDIVLFKLTWGNSPDVFLDEDGNVK